jgi:hypothetical protein
MARVRRQKPTMAPRRPMRGRTHMGMARCGEWDGRESGRDLVASVPQCRMLMVLDATYKATHVISISVLLLAGAARSMLGSSFLYTFLAIFQIG